MIPVAVAHETNVDQVAFPEASDIRTFPSHGAPHWIWIVDPNMVAPDTQRSHWREVPPQTVSVVHRLVAPPTPRVEERVVAPVTQRTHWREVPQATVRVFDRFVAPTTPSVDPNIVAPVARNVPPTSSVYQGAAVPIPIKVPFWKRRDA